MSDVNYTRESVLDSVGYEDEEDATEAVADDDVPYLPAKGMSIPVPKSFGKYVQKIFEETRSSIEAEHLKWDMQFRLYRKCGNENLDTDLRYADHADDNADENIIRMNIRNVMRTTYMQNPKIEFTDVNNGELADSLEYILDFILNKEAYPGVNMKPKARRWILHGQLTNFGVVRLDYQPRDGSRQEAVIQLREIEKKMAVAKDKTVLKELYANLEQLHKAMPLSQNKGMSIANVLPQNLIVDPKCTMPDLSDADWVAEVFDMDRVFMQQTYYEKDEDGVLRMISNPKATTEAVDLSHSSEDTKSRVIDIVLGQRSDEQNAVVSKDTVRCVYFYDKILRRCSLFNTEDWCYPLWVEEDNLLLSRFFRHFIIQFGEPIDGIVQPGESSFYVGQVEEINRINRNAKKVRDIAFNTLVYNRKGVDSKEITKLVRHLNNPKGVKAFGISNDSDKKINELLEALVPPSFAFKEIYDTTQLRAAVNRAANQSEVEQGGQFKTNTTNDAVGAYNAQRQETTGVLVDIIEDAFSSLAWAMTEILVSKYSTDDVVALVGPEKAKGFEPMTVEEFNQTYRMELASGSIEKPTTEFKKQEAMKIAGAIGQVGQGAPGTSLRIILRMFKNAFSGMLFTKQDADMLQQETQANLTKGVSTNGTAQPGQ